MKILIDNGHGVNTARAIVADCKDLGYDAELLVPEEYDVCLSARCYRANCWCDRLGKRNVLLVSIHVNAAGKGDRRLRMDYSDSDPDIESDFAILKKTACPAVLTENGFQDCEESLLFLESNEGKEAIIGLHVDGILDFINPNREYGYKDLTRHRR